MKKISFNQLESARKSPKAFAKSLDNPDGSTPRFSKFMAWQLAVFEYHKQKSNISKAISYFESLFSRNFADNPKNKIEKEEWIEQLEAYTLDEVKKKLIYVEHKKRISIPLTGKIRLGGELPLIKMNNRLGYSVYFFVVQILLGKTNCVSLLFRTIYLKFFIMLTYQKLKLEYIVWIQRHILRIHTD